MRKLSELVPRLYLASRSQGRLELLRSLGTEVIPCPTDCNESHTQTLPGPTVQTLALRKLDAFINSKNFTEKIPALAADTLIWFEDRLIGKAEDHAEARRQIQSFSGKTHTVYTGYALHINGKTFSGFDTAEVTFRKVSPDELEKYIASEEWRGAAGSYRCTGLAANLISRIYGDITTVTGLPIIKLTEILNAEILNAEILNADILNAEI